MKKSETKQLGYWKGAFGNEYIERNSSPAFFEKRKSFFSSLLTKYPSIHNVLEIGCNIGGNLQVLHDINPSLKLTGIEPNQKAATYARTTIPKAIIVEKSSFEITWRKKFDLVFTAGVLIHIADNDLDLTLKKMHDASKQYLLSIEYYSAQRETIPYRNLKDALFKRPYDKEYLCLFPNLKLLETGFLDTKEGFDKSHWWLFEK